MPNGGHDDGGPSDSPRYPVLGNIPDTPFQTPHPQDRQAGLNPFRTDEEQLSPNLTSEETTLMHQYLRGLRTRGKKPEQQAAGSQYLLKKRSFTFVMPTSTLNIPTLKGSSNWDRWYQSVYGCCQIAGIHLILTGKMTQPQDNDNDEFTHWETANSWIEGNICMSLESSGHTHIAGISGGYNMIKALERAYKSKGYTSREVLWRTVCRASLANYQSIPEYVEAIKTAKTKLAELGYHFTWQITTCLLHGLPSSYESFVQIILNSRGKDSATGELLEPVFDDVVEQLVDTDRRQKLINLADNDNSKALATKNNNNNRGDYRGGFNHNNLPCSVCGNSHGNTCYFQHQDQAPTWWIERNKDRLDDYNKKKNEKPKIHRAA